MANEGATDRRRRASQVSAVVGGVVALLAVVFVVRTLRRDWDDISAALDEAQRGWLVAAALPAAAGMVAIAVPWRRALRVVGAEVPLPQVVARYFVGEIGKYVPGGVWPLLGRGELATRAGVRRSAAYSSVALSLATLYLAAATVVVVGLPSLLGDGEGIGAAAVVVLLPIGLVVLHPRVLGRLLALVERLTNRTVDVAIPSWGETIRLVLCYVPAWLFIGTATWVVARGLDPSAPLGPIVVAAVLSWLVGFVLVPVPGGVGVREAAFVAAAGSLDPGIAAATAVVARTLFVLVDVIGALLGSVVQRRS
jgi:hypothetical protein